MPGRTYWPSFEPAGICAALPQVPFFSVMAKALSLVLNPFPTAIHSPPGAQETLATWALTAADVPGTLIAVPHVPGGAIRRGR